MSTLASLQLKQPTEWFAAGREVAEALMLLPDPSFRPYIYLRMQTAATGARR